MHTTELGLPGVLLIRPDLHRDRRGFLLESYNARRYAQNGVDVVFVQDNQSHSVGGVLRGLHYQLERPQGKLVSVVQGRIFDVAVDIRLGSPTFGKWVGAYLSGETREQLYVPPGFAHGFCVVSARADVHYKCTDFYTPGDEYGVVWDDPDLGIEWPIESPLISEKDACLPRLSDAPPESDLPSIGVDETVCWP